MVAVFLPPELAREVLRQADLSSSSATAAAREDNLPNSPKQLQLQQRISSPNTAAAELSNSAAHPVADDLAGKHSSPFADSAANGSSSASPGLTQQQQHRSDGGIADSALDMNPRSRSAGGAVPGDLRSVSDTGRPAAAAAGQQQQLRPGGTAGRDRSRPVLSSMSVQLTSRCGLRVVRKLGNSSCTRPSAATEGGFAMSAICQSAILLISKYNPCVANALTRPSRRRCLRCCCRHQLLRATLGTTRHPVAAAAAAPSPLRIQQ
jgi:hypothetical protein